MFDFVNNLFGSIEINTQLAIWLYWVPMLLALVNCVLDCTKQYHKEIKTRNMSIENGYRFEPELTIGSVFKGAISCMLPVVNLLIVFFVVLPTVFGKAFKVFDVPLVPAYKPPKD